MLSLESIVDEIAELENKKIHQAVEIGGEVAVDKSRVDTGRFKASWDILIDQEAMAYNSVEYDKQGDQTKTEIERDAKTFDIREDTYIKLYNAVEDEETNAKYSQTVGYDFTEQVATDNLQAAYLAMLNELQTKD